MSDFEMDGITPDRALHFKCIREKLLGPHNMYIDKFWSQNC